MGVVVIVIVIVGSMVALTKVQGRSAMALAGSREAGRLAFRRSGDYPSSCSWCKNTALARKLFVFDRSTGTWRAHDILGELRTCGDGAVDPLTLVLTQDLPRWRRFCCERCTMEFFAAERIEPVEAFGSCEYCSCRYPMGFAKCTNCGAMGHGS